MREGLWTWPFQFDSHRRFWCEGGAVEWWLLYFHVTTKICNHRCSDIITFYYFYRNIRPNLWPTIRVCAFASMLLFLYQCELYICYHWFYQNLFIIMIIHYFTMILTYFLIDAYCPVVKHVDFMLHVLCQKLQIKDAQSVVFLHVLHVLNTNICIPDYCGHLRRNINW